MTDRRHETAEKTKASVNLIFGETQYSKANLAMLFAAMLLSSQFLLLRLRAPIGQATTPPAARVDLQCAGGTLRSLTGGLPTRESMAQKTVVLHLDAEANACVQAATAAGVSEIVVGVSIETTP